MKNLTNLQRDELIERFTELVVDNMSHESLVCYAQEMMADYHDRLSDNELIETIDCYDPDLYDELVDNVTQQYPNDAKNPTFHMDQAFARLEKEGI